MNEQSGNEAILELLLRGVPSRLIDALTAGSSTAAAEIGRQNETLADLALSATPVAPSPSLRARILAARPRPQRPKRPVLAVLDMICDHLAPGRPLEVPRARAIVPALKRRIAEARASGTPVIYLCDSHPPDDVDFREWPRHAVEGTEGAEVWPELAPAAGDHVVRKRTYSAFNGSTLAPLLDELGADSIVLTGCATEIGMMATATDALQHGFVVTIPPDCQAGASEVGETAALVALSTMAPYDPRYLRAS